MAKVNLICTFEMGKFLGKCFGEEAHNFAQWASCCHFVGSSPISSLQIWTGKADGLAPNIPKVYWLQNDIIKTKMVKYKLQPLNLRKIYFISLTLFLFIYIYIYIFC